MKIDKNRRQKVVAALIILVMLWTGNNIYYVKHQLKHPLFMNHYYEVGLDDTWRNYSFELYYLTNRSDDREIVEIQFPGTDLKLSVRNSAFQTYRYQVLKQLYVELSQDDIKALLNIGGEYRQAEVQFSDGERSVVDLGVICFYKAEDANQYIVEESTGVGIDSIGFHLFKALEPIEVISLDYSYRELLPDELVVIDIPQLSEPEVIEVVSAIHSETKTSSVYSHAVVRGNPDSHKFPLLLDSGDSLKVTYHFQVNKSYLSESSSGNMAISNQIDTFYRLREN